MLTIKRLSFRQTFFLLPLLILTTAVSASSRFSNSLSHFTYVGGDNNDIAFAITVDEEDNIYIAGSTTSEYFDHFYDRKLTTTPRNNQNCFIVKISSDSPNEDWLFELSGNKRETCRELALDNQGNVYITGETQSSDFPTTTQEKLKGEWDVFIVKLNSVGELLYSSLLGGENTDYGHGLAVLSPDHIYISGETWSTEFPTTDNAFMKNCKLTVKCNGDNANAYVTHLDISNPKFTRILYSTYIGGSNQDKAHDLAIDNHGHLHIVGETRSQDFPLNNQLQDSLDGTFDGFLVIIDPSQQNDSSFTMGTYLGGSKNDYIYSVTTNDQGDSVLSGETWSDNFPTTKNAFSRACAKNKLPCMPKNKFNAHSDIFVSVIRHNHTSELLYSSLFGGNGNDTPSDIYLDESDLYVTGVSFSDNFPLTDNAYKTSCSVSKQCKELNDGIILKIDLSEENNRSLQYSSYIGGNKSDSIFSMASNKPGEVYLAGSTYSKKLSTPEAFDHNSAGGEAFYQRLSFRSGNYIDQNSVPQKTTTGSALSLLLVSLFSLIFVRRRNSNQNSFFS